MKTSLTNKIFATIYSLYLVFRYGLDEAEKISDEMLIKEKKRMWNLKQGKNEKTK